MKETNGPLPVGDAFPYARTFVEAEESIDYDGSAETLITYAVIGLSQCPRHLSINKWTSTFDDWVLVSLETVTRDVAK